MPINFERSALRVKARRHPSDAPYSRHAGEGCRWYLISCDYFKTDFINLPISAGLRVTLIPHSSITSSLL